MTKQPSDRQRGASKAARKRASRAKVAKKKAKPVAEIVADTTAALTVQADDDEQRGRGRPTDFRSEYIAQATKLARLGATDEEMADFFEVHVSTLNRWKLAHEEFRASVKEGKAIADMDVASSLYRRANWSEYTEQQAIKVKEVIFGENGKRLKEVERVEVVEVTKTLPPGETSMIFWLKNRKADVWRDKHDVSVTHRTHEQALAELKGAIDGGAGPIIEHDDERGRALAPPPTRH